MILSQLMILSPLKSGPEMEPHIKTEFLKRVAALY
jgi:hypothetical protein